MKDRVFVRNKHLKNVQLKFRNVKKKQTWKIKRLNVFNEELENSACSFRLNLRRFIQIYYRVHFQVFPVPIVKRLKRVF